MLNDLLMFLSVIGLIMIVIYSIMIPIVLLGAFLEYKDKKNYERKQTNIEMGNDYSIKQ
jgi:hypothetical protein